MSTRYQCIGLISTSLALATPEKPYALAGVAQGIQSLGNFSFIFTQPVAKPVLSRKDSALPTKLLKDITNA
jgi:hypothetical protein